jgi:uncharacterized tellurite resistance protein B-like protein
MEFKDFSQDESKMRQLSHIRNLLALAVTDGSFDQVEKDLIYKICLKSGVSKEELEMLIIEPQSIKYSPPVTNLERVEQLFDMVNVIMADGRIATNELALCKVIAVKLGFNVSEVNMFITNLIDSIQHGKTSEEAYTDLLRFL